MYEHHNRYGSGKAPTIRALEGRLARELESRGFPVDGVEYDMEKDEVKICVNRKDLEAWTTMPPS